MAVMTSPHSDGVALEQKIQPVPSDGKMALDVDINGASTRDAPTLEAELSELSEPPMSKSAPSPLAADPLAMPAMDVSVNVDAFAANQELESQAADLSPPITARPPSTDTTTDARPSTAADLPPPESATPITSALEPVEAAVDDLSAATTIPPIIESQESHLRHDSPSAQLTHITVAPELELDLDSAQLPTPQPEKDADVAGVSAVAPDLTSVDQAQSAPDQILDVQDAPLPPQAAVDHSFDMLEQATPPETMAVDAEMPDAPPPPSTSKIAREREDDGEMEPSAKRTKTEDESKTDEAAPAPTQNGEGGERSAGTPISPYQVQQFSQALKSACKSRNGMNFRAPVTELWPALTENYLAKISKPIDLKTMDHKLTSGTYRFMEEFTSDLHLLYNNTLTYNGQFHDVSKAAFVIRANLLSKIENTPSEPVKAPKRDKKPKRATTPKPRRESRDANPVPAPIAPPAPTFALDPATSLPLIRRDSTKGDGGRPKREIHPPKSKDLVYAHHSRPKNKKHAVELKFCETVLDEVRKDKYAQFSYIFQTPVDPVALNIPTYFTIIKKPMDLSTMSSKLKSGNYITAGDFEKDMRLMLANCYKFNPPPNVVYDMGRRFEELFNEQWKKKDQWIQDHTPAATSPISMPESEEEEEEEEEEDTATGGTKDSLEAARKILLDHQTKLIDLMGAKNRDSFAISMQQDLVATVQKRLREEEEQAEKRKTKKAKTVKAPKKAHAPAPKKSGQTKKKEKPKYMGSLEKEVISAGLMDLPDDVSLSVLDKIKKERPGIDTEPDGTLELDIDVISVDLLWEIYNLIMHHRPEVRATVESTMAQRESPRVLSKPAPKKKNKPMSKETQEQNLKALQQKLGTYERASSGSQSQEPVLQTVEQHEDDSSGDESDSEEE